MNSVDCSCSWQVASTGQRLHHLDCMTFQIGRMEKKTKKRKPKELEFVCQKCEHHLFVTEKPGWVQKVVNLDCPSCGQEAGDQWFGLWILLGYGRFADWTGSVL